MAETETPILKLPAVPFREIYLHLLPDILPPECTTFGGMADGREAFSDLLNLARSCRTMYRNTTYLLEQHKARYTFRPGLFDYFRAIYKNKNKIAKYETHIEIPLWDAVNRLGAVEYGDQARVNRIQAEENAFAPHGSPLFRPSRQKSVCNLELEQFHVDFECLFSLALYLTPKITSNSIHSQYNNPKRHGTLQPIPIRRLREAKLYGPDYNLPLGFHSMKGFLRYIGKKSKIKTLWLQGIRSCGSRFTLCRLKSITLNATDMDGPELWKLIGKSEELEEVVYRSGRHWVYLGLDDDEPVARPRGRTLSYLSYSATILEAFTRTEALDTPETLELDLREEVAIGGFYTQFGPPTAECFIDTFMSFKWLRNLRITQQVLWHPSCDLEKLDLRGPERLINLLPRTIISFHLSDITSPFLSSVIRLAVEGLKVRPKFRHLREVQMRPSPSFLRQLKHAVAHENDDRLPPEERRMGPKTTLCIMHGIYLKEFRLAEEIFKKLGIDAKFPLEVLPIHTTFPEDRQRQKDLCHWCLDCHLDDVSCVVRAADERSELDHIAPHAADVVDTDNWPRRHAYRRIRGRRAREVPSTSYPFAKLSNSDSWSLSRAHMDAIEEL